MCKYLLKREDIFTPPHMTHIAACADLGPDVCEAQFAHDRPKSNCPTLNLKHIAVCLFWFRSCYRWQTFSGRLLKIVSTINLLGSNLSNNSTKPRKTELALWRYRIIKTLAYQFRDLDSARLPSLYGDAEHPLGWLMSSPLWVMSTLMKALYQLFHIHQSNLGHHCPIVLLLRANLGLQIRT